MFEEDDEWDSEVEEFMKGELEKIDKKRKELISRLARERNEHRSAELNRLDATGATEAEKEEAVSRLEAEFKQRLSDALARFDAEGAEGEVTEFPPNHNLWLYVCILLGALCAVFYFVRKKTRN